jgi:HPt (histidine-containing phosphotransfer) domain-containing protein
MTPTPPDSPTPRSAALRGETIRDLREMAGEDGFARIRDHYLASTERVLAEMARAAETRHVAALLEKAHALKGASGALGASALQALCREFERLPPGASSAELAARVEALSAEFDRVRRAFAGLR